MTNLPTNDGGASPRPAGMVLAAIGLTGYLGVSGTITAALHLEGVIANALTRGYIYNFRLAALLLVGITIFFGGALCIAATRGLVRGQRPAWGYAMTGTLLLVLVALPLIPIQPGLAGPLSGVGVVNLIVLLVSRRRLEAG
jgi:hypothetical protein